MSIAFDGHVRRGKFRVRDRVPTAVPRNRLLPGQCIRPMMHGTRLLVLLFLFTAPAASCDHPVVSCSNELDLLNATEKSASQFLGTGYEPS